MEFDKNPDLALKTELHLGRIIAGILQDSSYIFTERTTGGSLTGPNGFIAMNHNAAVFCM